eukprot:1160951-Pelagomonas_calceolata.AAC.8
MHNSGQCVHFSNPIQLDAKSENKRTKMPFAGGRQTKSSPLPGSLVSHCTHRDTFKHRFNANGRYTCEKASSKLPYGDRWKRGTACKNFLKISTAPGTACHGPLTLQGCLNFCSGG